MPEEMGKRKDRSGKWQAITMEAKRPGQNISKTTSLVGCMQWLVPTKNGARKDNQWTGDRVMGAQDSLMHVESEGYPGLVRLHRRAIVAQITENWIT